MMDAVERLYKNFDILSGAKDKAKEHEKEFLEILDAVKGATNEKRLASQFIARFFKHFPNHADQAIDAVLDLCEDEDVAIRKQAIKDLPQLCRENRTFLPKIADVLAQLLQSDDHTEIKEVHNSLSLLFKIDAKGTLYGLFSQIQSDEAEDGLIRERTIKFLAGRMRTFGPDVINKEAEEILWTESKKSLKDVTGEEFVQFVDLLSGTQSARTVTGHQKMLDLIADQLDPPAEVTLTDPESRDKLLLCVRQAVQFVSPQTKSGRYVSYLIDTVVSRLTELGAEQQLEVLKPLAEMSQYTGELDNTEQRVNTVFSALLDRMPLPPDPAEEDGPVEPPSLEFSHIECLMYLFHQLARKVTAFLADNPDRLKDFRLRLQYLARGTQGYIKSLREALKDADLKSEENKIRAVALKTTSNINTMIKDLFHSPPIYKSTVSLSWKPMAGTAVKSSESGTSPRAGAGATGEKRRAPITFGGSESAPSRPKGGRPVYQPPSGKYSDRAGGYSDRPRGGGGYRGRYRGGGSRRYN